jgi:carbon starvation protein
LIAPRTRQILLVFIFFYLLLIAGAFGNLVAGVLADPRVPLGIIALAVLGLLAGQLLYRVKMDLIIVTLIAVGGTLVAVLLGADANGPVATTFASFNKWLNSLAPGGVTTVLDPTQATAAAQNVKITVAFVFWLLAMFAFCYAGSVLPIWRYAQPVNYIGFWITGLTIVVAGAGAFLAFFVHPSFSTFKLPAFTSFLSTAAVQKSGAFQPLYPMLFVTIACGAISGWHALIGSVGTARQIENEKDMLPVGGGAMFSEFTLGLLSLLAVSVVAANPKVGAVGKFAAGIGNFLNVFGIPTKFGTAIGFAAFVVIVITVTQLVFRVMRVTLAEWLGDRAPIFRNIHFSTLLGMAATLLLVLSGTWVYIWQLFGASNQLMASLSLLVVMVWLVATRRNPTYAAIPGVFMYVTTTLAALVTAWNLYNTVFAKSLGKAGKEVAVLGSGVTILIALLIVVAAIAIAYDGIRALQRYRRNPLETAPVTGVGSAT